LELLKVQKGIIKLRNIKGAAQPKGNQGPEVSKFQASEVIQYSKTCLCKDSQQSKPDEQDTPANSQNSNNLGSSPIKKNEKKNSKVLVCSYCDGAYHLSCMIAD
jgi:hypothetical protein